MFDLRLSFGRPSASSLQVSLYSLWDNAVIPTNHMSASLTPAQVKMTEGRGCAWVQLDYVLPQPALDQHKGQRQTNQPWTTSWQFIWTAWAGKVGKTRPTLISCHWWKQEALQHGSLSAIQESWSGPHFNPRIKSGSRFDVLRTRSRQANFIH